MTAFTDNLQIDDLKETKFIFMGWNTRRQRTEVVAYMARTAKEAWDTCARNCPDLQVALWDVADNF